MDWDLARNLTTTCQPVGAFQVAESVCTRSESMQSSRQGDGCISVRKKEPGYTRSSRRNLDAQGHIPRGITRQWRLGLAEQRCKDCNNEHRKYKLEQETKPGCTTEFSNFEMCESRKKVVPFQSQAPSVTPELSGANILNNLYHPI